MFPTQPTQLQPQQPSIMPPEPPSLKSSKGKRLLAICIILAIISMAAGALAWWLNQNQTDASLQQDVPSVSITAEGYTPSTIKVKVGEEVTWTNTDSSPHELAADTETVPGFGSTEALNTGDTYSYTFEDAGTYRYYDPAAPAKLNGTVVVE
jgi:plastocyanin